MKKSLKVDMPLISTYTHHAYSMMALSDVKDAKKWIYSNYIMLYLNKDLNKNAWGDFYFPMPYESKCYENCPYLKVQKNEISYIMEKYNDVVKYVIESIDRGYYVHIMVNYYYISQSQFYGVQKRNHDCFIYGYDDELEELYCSDFMFSDIRKLSFGTILFDEFEKAIESAAEDEDYILNNYVFGIKPFESEKYEYDINNMIYGLKGYLVGTTPEYWLGYNYCNKSNICWGLECYNAYVDYLRKSNERIDLRFLYLFMDHKKVMVERLKFLKNDIGMIGLEKYITENNELHQKLFKALNLLLKYSICNKKDILYLVYDTILEVRIKEERCLKSLIAILEK